MRLLTFIIYSLRIAILATVAVLTLTAASLYALPFFRVLLVESALGVAGSLAAIVISSFTLSFAIAWTAMFVRDHRHGHWSHIETRPRH